MMEALPIALAFAGLAFGLGWLINRAVHGEHPSLWDLAACAWIIAWAAFFIEAGLTLPTEWRLR